MPIIHPTAVVDPKAKIADDVEIGPLCIVGENVTIGSKTKLIGQCHITGYTTIGENNQIFPGTTIGLPPQDASWTPDVKSYVKIGDNNIFREHVTIHSGSKEGGETIVGNGCFLMVYCHLAHECKLGDRVIMVTNASLAGFVELMDGCFISGLVGVHQFCRVGRYAMISGCSAISLDLPPFMIADGRNGAVRGVNIVAMRRNDFSKEEIRAMKEVYKLMYRSGLNIKSVLEKIKAELPKLDVVDEFVQFVESSERGVLHGKLGRRG